MPKNDVTELNRMMSREKVKSFIDNRLGRAISTPKLEKFIDELQRPPDSFLLKHPMTCLLGLLFCLSGMLVLCYTLLQYRSKDDAEKRRIRRTFSFMIAISGLVWTITGSIVGPLLIEQATKRLVKRLNMASLMYKYTDG